jgi:hypothetical protein
VSHSSPFDGVEVGDGDDGADDGDEHDPAGHDAEQEVLERRRQRHGLSDVRHGQRRSHGGRAQPGRHLLLHGRPDDCHPSGRRPRPRRLQGLERRRGAERLPEPGDGDGGERRGGGHGERGWRREEAAGARVFVRGGMDDLPWRRLK